MATGIQSSANIPGSAAAPANQASQGTVHPGAGSAAPTANSQAQLSQQQKAPVNPSLQAITDNHKAAEDSKDVGAKVYHSFPGSSFFAPDGTRYEFDAKGVLETKNDLLQKELDKIADKPGSPVYAKNLRATPAPGDERAVEEIQTRAAQTMEALRAQQK